MHFKRKSSLKSQQKRHILTVIKQDNRGRAPRRIYHERFKPSKQKAINQFNKFLNTWQDKEPRVCKNFKNNFINTLNHYDFPEADRNLISTSKSLRTLHRRDKKNQDTRLL